MHILQIMLLAAVQGLTELLPVSSSAHVIVAERLMGFDPASPEMTFLLVMLHTGTMFSVLIYFWPRWRRLMFPGRATTGSEGNSAARNFLTVTILATACTGVLGLALKFIIERIVLEQVFGYAHGEVEQLFRNVPLIAAALLAGGLLIIAAGIWEKTEKASGLTPASSVAIGIVQGLCLPFRGFSRSGATISTGLFCGLRRDLAEDFSFALAVVLTPPVIVLELRRLLRASAVQGITGAQLAALTLPGVLGMFGSFLAGLEALWWLSAWLERGRWRYF
ncbi:MAG TPA: undecaprenyl-diphosphate phosphatase, partial [Candidatus Methylomirabilis sp.]|nr:undecaprenyl-diphosphate phosphatase [Candidatus Methylomirabilis sp.]